MQYSTPNRVIHDVESLLSKYPSLKPKAANFSTSLLSLSLSLFLSLSFSLLCLIASCHVMCLAAYENGQGLSLICVEGTVPINFRGQQYNIPLNIWLHRNYPMAPPTSFVVPTATMVVKPSKHVDTSGRVYMPYLHNWVSQPDVSNLIHMTQLMIEIFSQMPPLFSKPASPAALNPPAAATASNPGGFPLVQPNSKNGFLAPAANAQQRPVSPSPVRQPQPVQQPYTPAQPVRI